MKEIREIRRALNPNKDLTTEDGQHVYECCLCHRIVIGHGNNPYPIMKNGSCCDDCNSSIVIPARIMSYKNI